jgi:CRP/FNR family transcriptional regulator, dissimilatory nitrate respiration regulator
VLRREIKTEAFLANLPLFKGLSALDLARLAAGTSRRKLKRGETLFREGEPAAALHVLAYGRLQLSRRTPGGRERVSGIVLPGRSFGDVVMLLEKPYIVTATALADSLVLRIGKESIYDEIERNPKFARRVIAMLAQRVEGLVRELETYALGSAKGRFIAWLLQQQADQGGDSVLLPASKSAVASTLNVSAEHLSRILGELGDAGLIEVQGRRIRIADAARLRAWKGMRQPRHAV